MFISLSGNCTLPNSVTYHVNVPERIFPLRGGGESSSPTNLRLIPEKDGRWDTWRLLERKKRKGKERKRVRSQGCSISRRNRDFVMARVVGQSRNSVSASHHEIFRPSFVRDIRIARLL